MICGRHIIILPLETPLLLTYTLYLSKPVEKFAALIKPKQGNSSGGPSGLQYKHLQYLKCLAEMGPTHSGHWKWKWLVAIPKNALKRI